jgi:hypothetical protein
MSDNLLPKDQEEIDEWRRLQGEQAVLDELHDMYELDEFEDFYKSKASSVLTPWLDRRTKEVRDRLSELYELIKQRYEL